MRNLLRERNRYGQTKSEGGFSLMEVLMSMVVLTTGLVGLLAVFAYAVATTQSAQEDMIAKMLASEAMESIFTAREAAQISWQQIQNTGTGLTPDGIFVQGLQPINQAGADGIYGTADDAAAPARTLQLPGPDGILGTPDDQQLPLTNFQRQIVITAVPNSTSLRLVTITIQYTVSAVHIPKSYVLVSYISQFR